MNWEVGMRKSDLDLWNATVIDCIHWLRIKKIKNKCEAFGNYSAELRDINKIRYSQESMHT